MGQFLGFLWFSWSPTSISGFSEFIGSLDTLVYQSVEWMRMFCVYHCWEISYIFIEISNRNHVRFFKERFAPPFPNQKFELRGPLNKQMNQVYVPYQWWIACVICVHRLHREGLTIVQARYEVQLPLQFEQFVHHALYATLNMFDTKHQKKKLKIIKYKVFWSPFALLKICEHCFVLYSQNDNLATTNLYSI